MFGGSPVTTAGRAFDTPPIRVDISRNVNIRLLNNMRPGFRYNIFRDIFLVSAFPNRILLAVFAGHQDRVFRHRPSEEGNLQTQQEWHATCPYFCCIFQKITPSHSFARPLFVRKAMRDGSVTNDLPERFLFGIGRFRRSTGASFSQQSGQAACNFFRRRLTEEIEALRICTISSTSRPFSNIWRRSTAWLLLESFGSARGKFI